MDDDDLPPPDEVLGNVRRPSIPILPPPPSLNINITAEQLASLMKECVNSALAERDALVTASSPLVAASAREMSTVPVSTSSIPPMLPLETPHQSPTAEQLTTPTFPVRKASFERVPQKDHRKTSVNSQSEIIKYCICPKDNDKHSKLSRLHVTLRAEGLLSMLLRIRTKPICDENNVYGYTPSRFHDLSKNPLLTSDTSFVEDDALSVTSSSPSMSLATTTLAIVPTSTIWVIEAVDMVCYDHDMARLYSLVTLMFHSDYHCHASITSELCSDAIYFYESIIKVVFGQLPKDDVFIYPPPE